MDPSAFSSIDWSGMAHSLGQALVTLAATKGAEKALEIPLDTLKKKGQGKVDEALSQGKYRAVREALDAAVWPAVKDYPTREERETALTVLRAMAEDAESEALRDDFAEQVAQSYLARTQDRPDAAALALTYRKMQGLWKEGAGEVPSQETVEEILERYFGEVRERLLVWEEFGFLRQYEQLVETKKQTALLQEIATELKGRPVVVEGPLCVYDR